MGSFNKTTLLYFFLIIKIVCVVCPTDEQIGKCEEELASEFQNEQPLDDLLHAFLHIKYHTVYWNQRTNENEHIYFGSDVLKLSAGGYLNDLYTIAQEMGLPEIPSPQNFCSTQYGSLENECLSALEAIGCEAHFTGADCFEKMYFKWTMTDELYSCMPGTELLSDKELLDAIYKGSDEFRDLYDEDLIEALSSRTDILEELSDENLLQEYYRQYYEVNHMFWEGHSNAPGGSYPKRNDDFYGRSAYNEYVRRFFKSSNDNVYRNDTRIRGFFDEQNLSEARMNRYGIPRVSYEVVCREYQRRKSVPKVFDNLYATEICERFKESNWDTSNFISRKDFCVKYLTELEAYSDNESSTP